MITVETIVCRACGEDRSPQDFFPNRAASNGRQSQCKRCYNAYRRRRYWERKLGRPVEGFADMTDDEFWTRVADRAALQLKAAL